MKNRYLWCVLSGLLVLFITTSCKSTPVAEEPSSTETPAQQDPGTPDRAALDALDAAAARAEAARQLASDFEGPYFFPGDWQDAESLFSQAEQQKNTSTAASIRESTDRYNRAADAYEALAEKAVAAAFEYAERELTAARNAALAAGAEVLTPDYLLETDNVVAGALEKYEAGDFYGAKDSALSAFAMYGALKAGLDAYNAREQIADKAEELVPDALLSADSAGMAAIAKWEAGDFDGAKADAETVLVMYLGVAASAERQNALNYRANVAVRQDFNSTQTIFTQANTAFQAHRYDEAVRLYRECTPMFAVLAQIALEKQREAEENLQRANRRMAESDQTARDAERILEGGLQ